MIRSQLRARIALPSRRGAAARSGRSCRRKPGRFLIRSCERILFVAAGAVLMRTAALAQEQPAAGLVEPRPDIWVAPRAAADRRGGRRRRGARDRDPRSPVAPKPRAQHQRAELPTARARSGRGRCASHELKAVRPQGDRPLRQDTKREEPDGRCAKVGVLLARKNWCPSTHGWRCPSRYRSRRARHRGSPDRSPSRSSGWFSGRRASCNRCVWRCSHRKPRPRKSLHRRPGDLGGLQLVAALASQVRPIPQGPDAGRTAPSCMASQCAGQHQSHGRVSSGLSGATSTTTAPTASTAAARSSWAGSQQRFERIRHQCAAPASSNTRTINGLIAGNGSTKRRGSRITTPLIRVPTRPSLLSS